MTVHKIGLGVYGGSGSSSEEDSDTEDVAKDHRQDSDSELKVLLKLDFSRFIITIYNKSRFVLFR